MARRLNGYFSFAFWDSEPIATNLNQAWLGFPELERFKLAALEVRDDLLQAPQSLSKKLPIQAKAYKCLVQVGFPNDLEAHVSKHFFQFLGAVKTQLNKWICN